MDCTPLQVGTREWWRWLREVRWFFLRLAQERSDTYHLTPKRYRARCGARRRDGQPCQAPAVWDHRQDRARNGRCRMHGGLSTGPRKPSVGPRQEGPPRLVPTLEELEAQAWAERNAGMALYTLSVRLRRMDQAGPRIRVYRDQRPGHAKAERTDHGESD